MAAPKFALEMASVCAPIAKESAGVDGLSELM
jgi:hypothetical protein